MHIDVEQEVKVPLIEIYFLYLIYAIVPIEKD